MFIGNIGTMVLAPFLMVSSWGGFGGDASLAQVQNSENNWRDRVEVSERFGSWMNFWRGDRPHIDSLEPREGDVGTTVTLAGENFSEESTVRFGKGEITDITVSDDGETLEFTIPESMGKYCPPHRSCTQVAYEVEPGTYPVQVQNEYRRSNAVSFTVTDGDVQPDEGDLTITDVAGPRALAVDTEGSWTVNVEGETEGNLEYSVTWGDEGFNPLAFFGAQEHNVQSSATFTHTYADTGSYDAEFTVRDAAGNVATATVAIEVHEEGNGEVPHIDSLSPARAEAGTDVTLTGSNFSSTSMVMIDESEVEADVRSSTTIVFNAPDLDPGTYEVYVKSEGEMSNTASLAIIDPVEGTVSINGLSAPTELAVGEAGTWTIDAASTLEGNLSYSVDWGEGDARMQQMGAEAALQASATFTHTYHTAGTYEPTFTVTDEEGNSAKVSATVEVVGDVRTDAE